MKIYSARHHRGARANLASVSASRPLRCVFFNELPWKTPAFGPWLQGMLERYELRKLERYPISVMGPQRGPTWDTLYLVYEFVPRADAAASAAATREVKGLSHESGAPATEPVAGPRQGSWPARSPLVPRRSSIDE